MKLGILPDEYKDNEIMVYKMLSQGHLVIKNVSPRLQQNKNVIEMALKINKYIGNYLCAQASNNTEIMTLMVKREDWSIKYLGDQLASNKAFLLKLESLNPKCKTYLD